MNKAVLVSVQFLIPLPDGIDACAYGVDWLAALDTDAYDYRHPKISGVYLRPVPVLIKDMDRKDLFDDDNIIQL